MAHVHLTENRLVIKTPSRSCSPRTKGQAKPWQDVIFQLLCRGLRHGHVCTQSNESCTEEAHLSLMGMAIFGCLKTKDEGEDRN